jgi:hypothetical protein
MTPIAHWKLGILNSSGSCEIDGVRDDVCGSLRCWEDVSMFSLVIFL